MHQVEHQQFVSSEDKAHQEAMALHQAMRGEQGDRPYSGRHLQADRRLANQASSCASIHVPTRHPAEQVSAPSQVRPSSQEGGLQGAPCKAWHGVAEEE